MYAWIIIWHLRTIRTIYTIWMIRYGGSMCLYAASSHLSCLFSLYLENWPKGASSDCPILYSLRVFKWAFCSIDFCQTQRMNKYLVLYTWLSALILIKVSSSQQISTNSNKLHKAWTNICNTCMSVYVVRISFSSGEVHLWTCYQWLWKGCRIISQLFTLIQYLSLLYCSFLVIYRHVCLCQCKCCKN